jgi:hypothetical protein
MHLINHLERYLGRNEEGWTSPPVVGDKIFQVARFADGESGGHCFSTIGLSHYPLRLKQSGKEMRCELLMMVHKGIDRPAAILHQVGLEMIDSGSALSRGDVVGPRNKMFESGDMSALYATIPVYLPDEFAACDVEELGPVVFIWLVPIHEKEAEFISRMGWDKFEDKLEEQDVDLTDVERDCLSL